MAIAFLYPVNADAAEYNIVTNDSWVNGNGTTNFYTMTLPESGRVTITCQSYGNSYLYFYDGELIKEYINDWSDSNISGSELSPSTKVYTFDLEPGTYKIKINSYDDDDDDDDYSPSSTSYRLKASFKPVNNTESEPNNIFDTATPLSSGNKIKGFFSEDDDYDYYKFQVKGKTTARITLNTSLEYGVSDFGFTVWNSDLINITKDNWTSKNSGTYIDEMSLSSGTYYIKISKYYGYTGTYYLSWKGINYVSGIKLNKNNLILEKGKTYNLLKSISPSNASNKKIKWTSQNSSIVSVNSSGKITAKQPGATNITATATDGSGVYSTCQIVVRPPKTVISSCILKSGRNVEVKVKSQKNISGIEYNLSRSKKFNKKSVYYSGYFNATTDQLTRKKTYYFRARSYIYVNGKYYYGAWSNIKTIKTKSNGYLSGYYSWKDV